MNTAGVTVETKKIQPIISRRTYDELKMVTAEERASMTAIVERALREYICNHHPDISTDV